ncbi:hypothetical protein MTR_8g104420 [Medicago truncatula]|uniref:Uncharacterized protein n=1 Tax=Medicago truncatula TaxID=3880 RepID=G7L9R7_MEDTR|nr:hypothetical protein MTR_8g104420 [Medicago truncatula]
MRFSHVANLCLFVEITYECVDIAAAAVLLSDQGDVARNTMLGSNCELVARFVHATVNSSKSEGAEKLVIW